LHEPSALSYVEAAAAGIGSVATASGGSSTLVGDAGVVVEPTDTDALRAAMAAFCEPDYARRAGAAARDRAARFTWTAVAGRLVAALTGRPGDFL
jgi:glycosyltransferase involved in cell wall biosynthesis